MVLKRLLQLLLFTLIMGQFSKVGDLYLFDAAAAIFVFYGLFYFLKRKSLKLPKYAVLFVIFSLIALGSFLFNSFRYSGEELFVAALYLLRFVFYVLSAIVTYNMLLSKSISFFELEKYLIVSALILCGAGLVQLVIFPDFGQLDPSLGWDPHKNRVVSTFFDPNFLGAYLVLVLSLILVGYRKSKFLFWSFLTLSVFIFLTFSRSAWAMLSIVIFVYGIFRQPKILILGLLLAFSAYFFVPRVQTRLAGITDPADSARFRLVSWKNALTISKDNLITGVGFNAYRYAQKEYGFLDIDTYDTRSGAGADSSILFVLATTGLAGVLLYVAGFIFPFLDNLLKKKSGDLFILMILPAVAVESLFMNSLFYPQIMFPLFSLIFISEIKKTDLA